MLRYYRHIRQRDVLIEDPDGIELPDLDAARTEAVDGVRDLLSHPTREG